MIETVKEAEERRAAYRLAEYEICQRRGHQPSGFRQATIPPREVCVWCGVAYYFTKPQLVEIGAPVARGVPHG